MLQNREWCTTAGNVIRKEIYSDLRARRKHNRTFDYILQFADIPRPGVCHQRAQTISIDPPKWTLVFL